ncbi:MAG: hypothetical protein ACYTEG_14890 [Planctomycetota bacterium]
MLALVHTAWTLYWRAEYRQRVDELRAAGERLELGAHAAPAVPREANANIPLIEADDWYENHLEPGEAVLENYIWDDLGEERAAESQEIWQEDLAALRSWLAGGDHYVELLAEAGARARIHEDLDWSAGPGMELPHFPRLGHAMEFLENRVKRAREVSPETLAELALIVKLARKLDPVGVVSLLVRWQSESGAADALQACARLPGFDAEVAWAELGKLLRTGPDTELLRTAFRGERATGLWVVDRLIDGMSPATITEWFVDGSDADSVPEQVFNWHYRALLYREGVRLLDLMARTDELLQQSPRDALQSAIALNAKFRKSGYPYVTSLWAVMPERAMERRLKYLARMRIARVGLALLMLRQRNGEWPADLNAVLPLVESSAIVDPYTGKTLIYEPGRKLEAAVPIHEEWEREFDEIVWRFPPAR